MVIEYNKDIPKHYVRKFGWLPACQQQLAAIRKGKRQISKTPLRYFTFCAAEAIDVFLLEKHRVLRRSQETKRLEEVFFCERDEDAYGRIAGLIGSFEQGFLGEFDKIVLFEDDEETKGKLLEDENEYEADLRKKLRFKDMHLRLHKAFPFDIINLDVFGVMFPPRKGIIAPLLKSLVKVLEWQSQAKFNNNRLCDHFTLFLTSHLDPQITDKEAIEQLKNRLGENLTANTGFKTIFLDRYEHDDPGKLAADRFAEFFCLAFSKYIVEKALIELEWEITHENIYLYNRDDIFSATNRYQIMHSVAVCKRIQAGQDRLDLSRSNKYAQKVVDLIEKGVTWVEDLLDETIEENLQSDLAEIIAFRDQQNA